MYYFMDIFYALNYNITKKVCVKFGQTDDYGKKFMKFDEVVGLVQQALKEPDHKGNYHDYIELCKLYDKNENGTMMLAELENVISNLGNLIDSLLSSHLLPSGYIWITALGLKTQEINLDSNGNHLRVPNNNIDRGQKLREDSQRARG